MVLLAVLSSGCLGDYDADGGRKMESVSDYWARLQGFVLDEEGNPVADANLTFRHTPEGGEAHEQTDQTGPGGFYSFEVRSTSPLRGRVDLTATAQGREPVHTEFTLSTQQSEYDIDLILQAGTHINPKPAVEEWVFKGRITCGLSAGPAYSEEACGLGTASIREGDLRFDQGLSGIVFHLSWTPTTPNTARTLRMHWKAPEAWHVACDSAGPSPLVGRCALSTNPHQNLFFGRDNNTAVWRVVPERGVAPGAEAPPERWWQDQSGVVFQQDFELWVALHYWGAPLPERYDPGNQAPA